MKLQTKTIALLATVWFASVNANAQVTIGSEQAPNENALLELTEGATTTKGLLLPRVELTATNLPAPLLAHVQGMTVYNTATKGSGITAVTPGEYYNDGTKWLKINEKASPAWFYAPSMPVNISVDATATLDLWQEYYLHFGGGARQGRFIASTGAPANAGVPVPPKTLFQKNELYYYVTGYDSTVFKNVSIDADGKMTYTVKAVNVTDSTFINVVFVVK